MIVKVLAGNAIATKTWVVSLAKSTRVQIDVEKDCGVKYSITSC